MPGSPRLEPAPTRPQRSFVRQPSPAQFRRGGGPQPRRARRPASARHRHAPGPARRSTSERPAPRRLPVRPGPRPRFSPPPRLRGGRCRRGCRFSAAASSATSVRSASARARAARRSTSERPAPRRLPVRPGPRPRFSQPPRLRGGRCRRGGDSRLRRARRPASARHRHAPGPARRSTSERPALSAAAWASLAATSLCSAISVSRRARSAWRRSARADDRTLVT